MVPVLFDVEKVYAKHENLRSDMKTIREWLSKQPHLPPISEHQLILFLHSCYFRIEATKSAIETYYTLKTHCKDMFSNLDPNSVPIQSNLNVISYVYIPEPTPSGEKILFSRILDTNPDLFVHVDQARSFYMFTDLVLLEDEPAEGHVMVYDMEGFTFTHMMKLNLMIVKQATCFLQEALPVRIKAIHIINANPLIDKILAMLKPLLSKEIYNMIRLHTKPDEEFFKMVPQRLMPNEYGGEQGTLNELRDAMKKKFSESAEYFRNEEKLRVDESKRQGKSPNIGNIFGAEGSFKKLSID